MLSGPDITFAAEPVLHTAREAIERDTVAHFEQAVRDGKRVVKDCVVGKVPHGKAVDPTNGTGVCCSFRVDAIDLQAKSEHGKALPQAKSVNMGESTGTVCSGPVSLPVP